MTKDEYIELLETTPQRCEATFIWYWSGPYGHSPSQREYDDFITVLNMIKDRQ